MADAAHDHPDQHFAHFGFLVQAHAPSDRLLRFEDGGRHHAAHRRLRPHPVVPHGFAAEHGDGRRVVRHLRSRDGRLRPDDSRHLPAGQRALCRLDPALHEAPPQAGLHALPRGGCQPEQHRAAHRRHAGDQAQRLREAEALGVGAHSGAAVPSLDQGARAGADAGGGRHVHRPDQERRHLVSGRLGGHRGPHDPRHDGRPAIHHRPAQRAAVAVHPVRAGDAGREDLARTPLGDSGERGRRAGRRGAHPRDSRPCRHRIPGRNVPVRRSALGQGSGRRVGNDSGGQGYGHRRGERLGEDHDAQADAGLLHADLGRGAAPRPPHRAVQPVVLAAGVRHGDAGGIRLFGYHSR
ncbi:hypothetical protein BN3659_00222 [Alistipes sp. CHKCI003]|nr:hypothetical protein BN3659_00222 [Alistipes sp. CHKCI003]